MIIQSSYCKQDHCIACLQRGTVLMLDVNGTPWSCVPSDMRCWLFYSLLIAHCYSSPKSDFFLTTQYLVLKDLYSFICLHRISEVEVL